MSNKLKWDLFISHASEDKEDFVKPLAILLHNIGVKVWYDEFTLKFGDSLSRSIDKGLSQSKYGVVVISKAFIEKRWPEYELQGLVTLEMAGKGKRIIPIWHGVKRKEVLRFSPSLADKLAADTSRLSLAEIATGIIEVVRPDIQTHLQRISAFQKLREETKTVDIPISDLVLGPLRHETLPPSLIVRIYIMHEILLEVFDISLERTINNFRRDMNPESELEIWENIAAIYLKLTANTELEKDQKKEIFGALLKNSFKALTVEDFSKFHYVTPEMLGNAWEGIIGG